MKMKTDLDQYLRVLRNMKGNKIDFDYCVMPEGYRLVRAGLNLSPRLSKEDMCVWMAGYIEAVGMMEEVTP